MNPLNRSQLSEPLNDWRLKIEAWAKDYGLDFYSTIFVVLDWQEMNMVAAYGGFPSRYPHWRFGMEYEKLSKSYAYGLSKIYEMVINNNPCYAYLLHANKMVDQKMVMAHVLGHCDFFKNNAFFGPTPKDMINQMGNHKARMTRLMDKLGFDRVESFIDVCLSLENLIDYQEPFRPKSKTKIDEENPQDITTSVKLKKEYLEEYINPNAWLALKHQSQEEELLAEPANKDLPTKDVMGFLLENAPLARWQYDVLAMIRKEAYYFAPQAQTKIMNEGWASYWHSKIMTQKALEDSEFIDFADNHSGTMAMSPQRLNPYKIGIELFRDIEERWNKGQFGSEYDACDNMVAKQSWNTETGEGRKKIFEVRKIYNDITFIDTFLTPEFCAKHKLFTFAYNPMAHEYQIASREFQKIKKMLLTQLTNFGQPIIKVVDANSGNRGELKLEHQFEGMKLDETYAKETLQNLYRVWQRPVLIQTQEKDKKKIHKFDGEKHQAMDSVDGV